MRDTLYKVLIHTLCERHLNPRETFLLLTRPKTVTDKKPAQMCERRLQLPATTLTTIVQYR